MGSAAAGRGARMIAAIASPAPAATRVALVAVMLPPEKPVLTGWKGARVRPGWAVSAALLPRAVKHEKPGRSPTTLDGRRPGCRASREKCFHSLVRLKADTTNEGGHSLVRLNADTTD